jgi:uroporphyrinogen decarboxylase
MTSRERLQTVVAGGIPDCVPVCPDISNMIPARLTGKPFWDIYLYNDPPLWQAYLGALDHFGFDAFWDAYYMLPWPGSEAASAWETYIVKRTDERIVTQACTVENGKRTWAERVDVYYLASPPTHGLRPEIAGVPPIPERWEPIEGAKPANNGPDAFKEAKARLGDRGMMGVSAGGTLAFGSEDDIYRYYDNPDKHEEWAEQRIAWFERRFAQIMAMEVKPDFLSVGGSGTLVYQTVEMLRKVALPATKRIIELATAAGLPTHIHSCGPEKELVKIMAEETNLTVIDPLERPPMGDCDLAEIKRRYGHKLVLKGNLHTTDVMLRGSVDDVVRASREAIDAAAENGRFILSTGDQCGRDTPDENIMAMIETARGYGRY